MFDVSACQLHITLEATEPIELERYAGSSLRGALYEALLRRFCMNPEATTCASCVLHATCPVAGLVAPLRDEHPRGRDTPRPFVIAVEPGLIHPNDEATAGAAHGAAHGAAPGATGSDRDGRSCVRLETGQSCTFAVTLFGRAIAYFPYLALSLSVVERQGLGRPLRVHHGRRGRPRVARIDARQPYTGERETLYRAGEQAARAPTLLVTRDAVAVHAGKLPTDRLAITFTTPTRLITDGRLLAHPDARALMLRLVERLEALEQAYGDASGAVTGTHDQAAQQGEQDERTRQDTGAREKRRERYLEVERQVRDVRVVADATRWVDVTSYSSRQRRFMPIGGFTGRATLEGAIEPLRELLVWGEIAHVGKDAVKGDGRYHVTSVSVPDDTSNGVADAPDVAQQQALAPLPHAW